MQLGIIGLGRMGAGMSRRLQRDGHEVVGFDIQSTLVGSLADQGIVTAAAGPADLASRLGRPRIMWIMVPAIHVDAVIEDVEPRLGRGDILIDGGNSFYRDSMDRSARLAEKGIRFLDIGVSGGIWGPERGFCLMIGGPEDAVSELTPVFRSLAPGIAAADRTPGRGGDAAPGEEGWLHCGPSGAGHFVKMVHNGIEYGVMAALAEGLAILERADVGTRSRLEDAETAPLRDPQYYRFDMDIPAIAELWRRGSVIRSWLLDLTAAALAEDPEMATFAGRVSDSGEGRWTVQAAVDEGVPANVIASALHQRFTSRDLGDFGDRLLSAMRRQFGGHEER